MQALCIAPFYRTRHRTKLCKWHLRLPFRAKPVTIEKPYLPAFHCRDQSKLFRIAWIAGVFLISSIFFQFPETDLPTRQLMVHQPWTKLRIIMEGEGKKLEKGCFKYLANGEQWWRKVISLFFFYYSISNRWAWGLSGFSKKSFLVGEKRNFLKTNCLGFA